MVEWVLANRRLYFRWCWRWNRFFLHAFLMLFLFHLIVFVDRLVLLVCFFWNLQWRLLCLVGVCLPLGWGFDWRVQLYLLVVGVSRLYGLHLFLVLLHPRTLARGHTYSLFGRSVRFLFFSLWWFFSLSFLRSSASFGHPLYDAGCPKFLQFTQ